VAVLDISGRFGTRADEGDYRFNAAAAAAAGSCYPSDVIDRLGSSGVLQKVEEDQERSCDVCFGPGKRDEVTVFTARLFTRLHT